MFDIESSGTVEIFNLAKKLESEGKSLIHLEVGELDFETPSYIIEATIDAIKKNYTKYTETTGFLSLRTEIIKYIESRYDLQDLKPKKNVMVTPGAKFGLFSALLSFLSPGDEIVVFSPSYPSFRSIPNAMKIKVREVPILDGSRIIPMDDIIEDLKSKLNERTRFFILNGPCNPTGQVIYENTVKRVWDCCLKYPRIWFLVDDIYEQFIFKPLKFETISKYDKLLERTIIVNGFSKSFAMTGFRLGYVVSNENVIKKLARFQQNSVTCATSFSQKAGEIALKSYNDKWNEYFKFKRDMMEILDKRRIFAHKKLNNIDCISCNQPEGAFYVFPNISQITENSYEYCMKLIENGVVTTPGSFFGQSGEGHARICYSRPIKELEDALKIIETTSNNYPRNTKS